MQSNHYVLILNKFIHHLVVYSKWQFANLFSSELYIMVNIIYNPFIKFHKSKSIKSLHTILIKLRQKKDFAINTKEFIFAFYQKNKVLI